MGFLASIGESWHTGSFQGPGPAVAGLLSLGDCLGVSPTQTSPSRPQPLPAFITDLHSESSLLFLLRARERKGQTDSWGSRQTFARVSLRAGEGDIQMGTHKRGP